MIMPLGCRLRVYLCCVLKQTNKRLFWGVYLLQWVLNVAWNPLFFKYHWT
ncbi:MAG: hypothetical protein EBS53_03180, partial [Bacteroidetes bacterium]|nr:hypothetical protein [Bacteroidota bacterium]